LDAIRYLHDLCTDIDHISLEGSGLYSIPIQLGIIKEFSFEDFILEGDIAHVLISLFEEVSASGRKINEIEIEKSANQKEKS